MNLNELKEMLCERGYEDVIVFENPDYADAFIGLSHDSRAVYDFDRMVQCLVDADGMEYDEAVEFIEYNTIRALPYYPDGPIVVTSLE